jgi:hypothetical protein
LLVVGWLVGWLVGYYQAIPTETTLFFFPCNKISEAVQITAREFFRKRLFDETVI